MNVEELEHKYLSIIDPDNLLKDMTVKEFEEWCSLETCKKDLECTLIALEESQMFEFCRIVSNLIKNYED